MTCSQHCWTCHGDLKGFVCLMQFPGASVSLHSSSRVWAIIISLPVSKEWHFVLANELYVIWQKKEKITFKITTLFRILKVKSFANLSSKTYFSFLYLLFEFLFLWIKSVEIKLQTFKQNISFFFKCLELGSKTPTFESCSVALGRFNENFWALSHLSVKWGNNINMQGCHRIRDNAYKVHNTVLEILAINY